MDGTLKRQLKKLDHDHSFASFKKMTRSSPTSSEEFSASSSEQLTANNYRRFFPPWLRRFTLRIYLRAQSLQIVLSEWVFLAVLGVVVSCVSAMCDGGIYLLNQTREWLTTWDSSSSPAFAASLAAWCSFAVAGVVASTTFVHYISPQAIGSGLPEMKTVIRGVILKDYLTLRTLVSKVIGLFFALGSGLPIGKMGPFVHIASVVANQLSYLAARINPAFGSETRRMDALTAACAVGVASTFSAPIGGVLFSIEVTTTCFKVRNYWRGFFAACCGAIAVRLLRNTLIASEVTMSAFYQTSFNRDAFTTDELPFFALLGIVCGVLGALYISAYKCLVLFLRQNSVMKKVFQRHWIVYPLVLSLILASVTYPHGFGKYINGRMRFPMNLKDFFTDCTFSVTRDDPLACIDSHNHSYVVFDHWVGGLGGIHTLTLLLLFIAYLFVCSLFCITLPIPSGIFMPIFVLGAAIGRLAGETMASVFPLGVAQGIRIAPGVYAVAGSASFSAAVTHTVSVSVIVFEATGQLHCILPVLIAVILSNAVCTYISPSFFDTIIKIKHLPFLPDIHPTNNMAHTICAEDIMTQPVQSIPRRTTYAQIRSLILTGKRRIFPVVDSDTEGSRMLIGTVSRHALLSILENHLGDAARKAEAASRSQKPINTISARINEEISSDLKVNNASVVDNAESVRNDVTSWKINCSRGWFQAFIKQAFRALRLSSSAKVKPQEVTPHDLNSKERKAWEESRLLDTFELDDAWIDGTPFQIVKKTTLFKIHSMFSLMQLSHAYVTYCGRLIGVVSLGDVRRALEQDTPEKRRKMTVADAERGETEEGEAGSEDILTPTLTVDSEQTAGETQTRM